MMLLDQIYLRILQNRPTVVIETMGTDRNPSMHGLSFIADLFDSMALADQSVTNVHVY